jgi:hypothetical protein
MRNHSRNTGTSDDGFRRIEVITGVGRRRSWTDEEKIASGSGRRDRSGRRGLSPCGEDRRTYRARRNPSTIDCHGREHPDHGGGILRIP